MLNYILRRSFYSIWVIAGVLALTFILFNMSAGDPAAAVLGKNALPEEIENFRRAIGGDLPLFYGRNCRTETFTNWNGKAQKVNIPRNFKQKNIVAKITFDDRSTLEQMIPDDAEQAEFSAPQAGRSLKSNSFINNAPPGTPS